MQQQIRTSTKPVIRHKAPSPKAIATANIVVSILSICHPRENCSTHYIIHKNTEVHNPNRYRKRLYTFDVLRLTSIGGSEYLSSPVSLVISKSHEDDADERDNCDVDYRALNCKRCSECMSIEAESILDAADESAAVQAVDVIIDAVSYSA